jgi:hypothetical protein
MEEFGMGTLGKGSFVAALVFAALACQPDSLAPEDRVADGGARGEADRPPVARGAAVPDSATDGATTDGPATWPPTPLPSPGTICEGPARRWCWTRTPQ